MTITNQFRDLGLSEGLVSTLDSLGITVPTPIQADVIPKLLSTDQDMIGIAHTGTGKTAAFGLPILDRINRKGQGTQALILTPTRELTLQVANALRSFSQANPVNVVAIVGGQGYSTQLQGLKNNPTIVVGTPGRLIDHVKRRSLILSNLTTLVLDEADEMLNVGFLEDIQFIFKSSNTDKRVMLFSATMSGQIEALSRTMLNNPIKIKSERGEVTKSLTQHATIAVSDRDKTEALCRVIELATDFYGMVFCRTKREVEQVASALEKRGVKADFLHGDLSQPQREKMLAEFKSKNVHVLVVTDVACRGIDVPSLTHVINYGLPQDTESYTHRSGRTGRAGKTGLVINIMNLAESRRLVPMTRRMEINIETMAIPGHEAVASSKQTRFLAQVKAGMHAAGQDSKRMAAQLLEVADAESVIAGLIEMGFRNSLSVGRPIAEPSSERSSDRAGDRRGRSSYGGPPRRQGGGGGGYRGQGSGDRRSSSGGNDRRSSGGYNSR